MALACKILRQTGKIRPIRHVWVNGAEVRENGWWSATCRRVPGAVQVTLALHVRDQDAEELGSCRLQPFPAIGLFHPTVPS